MKIQKSIPTVLAASLAFALASPAVAQEEQEKEQQQKVEITRETTTLTVKFTPVEESGITGTAEILPLEETEEARVRPIRLQLAGLAVEEERSYPVILYRGTCEAGGAQVGQIGTVAAVPNQQVTGQVNVTEADWKKAAELAEAEEEHAEKHAELAEEKEELEEEHAEEHAEEEYAEAGMQHDEVPLFIQVNDPQGTPVACANIEGRTNLFVPGK